MAHQAFFLPSYPHHIRREDFELIKRFDSFELYQSDCDYGTLLPALSQGEFLTIKGFDSYADFKVYLFDIYDRDWTYNTLLQGCSNSQFDTDYDLALAELNSYDDTVYDGEGEEGSCNMSAYNQQPYTKGRDVRANRRKNNWLSQKKAFRTEEILKAREEKEDRELKNKAKPIQKDLLRSGKAASKEEAKSEAESMVCLKPKVRFTRLHFTIVASENTEEVMVCPYKKRAAKTFHEKHKAMNKCASYQERLQEIRKLTRQVPGHDRKEAKRAFNVKHSRYSPKKSENSGNDAKTSVHQVYHNAIVRIVTGKHTFSFDFAETNPTLVKVILSKSPISEKLLSLLCTINH